MFYLTSLLTYFLYFLYFLYSIFIFVADYQSTMTATTASHTSLAAETLQIEKQRAHEETELAIKLLKESHFDEISGQHDKHASAIKLLNIGISDLNITIFDLNNSIKQGELNLENEKENRKNHEILLANELILLNNKHEKDIENEKKIGEKNMYDAMERVKINIGDLKLKFSQDCEKYDDLLKFEKNEYNLLEIKYKERPSRSDDINRIRQLENEIIDKDELVIKTREEMLYFKREMLNREENFNQKFGRSPNVGVMQVIKQKDPVTNMTSSTPSEKGPIKQTPGGFGGGKSSKPNYTVAPGGGVSGMGNLGGIGLGMSGNLGGTLGGIGLGMSGQQVGMGMGSMSAGNGMGIGISANNGGQGQGQGHGQGPIPGVKGRDDPARRSFS